MTSQVISLFASALRFELKRRHRITLSKEELETIVEEVFKKLELAERLTRPNTKPH